MLANLRVKCHQNLLNHIILKSTQKFPQQQNTLFHVIRTAQFLVSTYSAEKDKKQQHWNHNHLHHFKSLMWYFNSPWEKDFRALFMQWDPKAVLHHQISNKTSGSHICYWLSVPFISDDLTHGDKMAAISQTTFSGAFLWTKSFEFWLSFQWSLFLRVPLKISQQWFRW